MTIHVISVGISILKVFDDPRGDRATRDHHDLSRILLAARPGALLTDARDPHGNDVAQNADRTSDWIAAALTPTDTHARPLLSHRVDASLLRRWPAGISAELDTFHRVTHGPLDAADIAVLICSDTPRGLLAGLWNAIALTGGDGLIDNVAYLADPAAPLGSLRGRVLVVRLPGMDAGLETGAQTRMDTAMRGLGALAGHLVRHRELRPIEAMRCYLSGGYKAAIPYLIGMAEGVRSLAGARPVDAVVLHEESTSPPIRLPLRRIDPDLLQQELTGFRDGRRTSRPASGFLEGYAYTARGDREWDLTPFGHLLLALFGTAAPGLL